MNLLCQLAPSSRLIDLLKNMRKTTYDIIRAAMNESTKRLCTVREKGKTRLGKKTRNMEPSRTRVRMSRKTSENDEDETQGYRDTIKV